MTTKYPQIHDCISCTQDIVQVLRNHTGDCELEARFGVLDNNHFTPGVTRTVMESIIENMQMSPHVMSNDDWKEETDYYYKHDGRHLRTRIQFDSNNMNVISETTEKKMLCNSIDLKHMFQDENRGDMDVRISLKTESQILQPPSASNPYLVRIKQRRRFITENKCWAFDFSMTWSGISKSKAELSQKNDEPTFEIECELIDARNYLEMKNDRYIATSILLKMYDLLPDQSKLIMS